MRQHPEDRTVTDLAAYQDKLVGCQQNWYGWHPVFNQLCAVVRANPDVKKALLCLREVYRMTPTMTCRLGQMRELLTVAFPGNKLPTGQTVTVNDQLLYALATQWIFGHES